VKNYSAFVLSVVVVACAAFSAGVAAQVQPKSGERYQITPVGGGPGQWQTMPADSHSDSRAGPGIPESVLHPIVPSSSGPSGTFCGRAAVYTDSMGITERTPCQGHLVAYTATSSQQVWQPAQPAYYSGGENGTNYPATEGYFTTVTSSYFATDCPAGYSITTTGSSGPYQYYACIKA
jgi:hypothetical protein